MLIKTMAVKVTEKNLPVAIACLGADFARIPEKSALDYYLVINEVGIVDDAPALKITLTNTYYTREEFFETYEFVEKELKTNFTEVRHL